MNLNSPGKRVGVPLLVAYLRHVCKYLSRDHRGYECFSGSNPITFTDDTKTDKDYYVAEKTDGVRYLLLIVHNKLYDTSKYGDFFLVDRKNNFWGFFYDKNNEGEKFDPVLNYTLLDGELVIDRDGTKEKMVYYIFDSISIGDTYFGDLDFIDRLKRASKYIQVQKINNLNFEIKKFYKATQENLRALFESIKNLKHGNDGLIFNLNKSKYRTGSSEYIIKWKPMKEATVDFTIIRDGGGRYSKLMGYVYGYPFHFSNIDLTQEQEKLIENMTNSNKVVEVKLNENTNKWKFSKIRPDKGRGNEIETIKNVLESYSKKVFKEQLINKFQ